MGIGESGRGTNGCDLFYIKAMGAAKHSTMDRTVPSEQREMILPKMSIVPRLRNPGPKYVGLASGFLVSCALHPVAVG